MNIKEVIDATILGITYHPDIRDLSDATKKDIAKMIQDLVVKLNVGQPKGSADKVLRKLEMFRETGHVSYLDKAIDLLKNG